MKKKHRSFHGLAHGWAIAMALAAVVAGPLFAAPTIFPFGTTIHERDAAWEGYTVLSLLRSPFVVVIDMEGRIVKQWEGFNTSAGGPASVLPNGVVIAPAGARPGRQESLALVAQDFAGKELWRHGRNESIQLPDRGSVDSLRQHHDWARADFPSGYYAPGATPTANAGRTLVLTHTNREVPAIADGALEDDRLIELDASGNITWQWTTSDHVDEFGFDKAARDAIRTAAVSGPRGPNAPARAFDWLHINSATWLGPNRWFDAGDKRFAPDNVIISSRNASFLAIVARDGKVVWRIGPDFRESPAQRALGQMIGQHHAHLVPRGLPGEGNLLVFDNGGASGYGASSPIAPNGVNTLARATSRVLEINPVTLERVWAYGPVAGFFSTNISGAQRLPNGNTLITEGAPGRVFEVTREGRIVWEYMNPKGADGSNGVYRAYRIPYGWLPQIKEPVFGE